MYLNIFLNIFNISQVRRRTRGGMRPPPPTPPFRHEEVWKSYCRKFVKIGSIWILIYVIFQRKNLEIQCRKVFRKASLYLIYLLNAAAIGKK